VARPKYNEEIAAKILEAIANDKVGMSIADIIQETGFDYKTVVKYLRVLEKAPITNRGKKRRLIERRYGSARVVRLI